ncbi:hypothetical protein [Vreelandella aquamarina]|uniref:Uncharacterized protein n=1 Tax=Vreelandella aquamarina TaxID=77097 RepID=A0A1H8GQQ2_9GAMM|nr:hypothetical protein [Halomonas aquamarina]SEN45817.1 hypothetical protein SAMN04490369_101244 [Halomonas aquamarina]
MAPSGTSVQQRLHWGLQGVVITLDAQAVLQLPVATAARLSLEGIGMGALAGAPVAHQA